MVLWRNTKPSRTNTQNRYPFLHRGWKCKNRKLRDIWSNRQIWPRSTKWSRAKTNRVLPREHTGHSKHPLPTTQAMTLHMDIIRWSIPKSDRLYSLQQRWRSSTQSVKTRPGTDCRLDHELIITKFRLKLKKLGKSTRPFRSDQSLSRVRLFATPWIAARQASLSITNSQSSLRLTSIESVMPSSHLILCRPLLLLPSIPPSIRVFSNESTLRVRWPKYWSFSFSIIPYKEIPWLISFRMDWLDLLVVQGTLRSLLQHHSSKASILRCSAFFTVQLSHPCMT